MTDGCAIPGCGAQAELEYLGHGLCAEHWEEFNAGDVPPDALRMALGLDGEARTATEEQMAETTENDTTEQAAPAAEEGPMPTTKAPRTKKPAKKAKATKPVTAAKPPTAKKERAPKEDLVVFACRVAEDERVKFHEATGPGGASRFARKIMVAFSNEDESAFRALLKEAKEARG